MLKHSRNGNNRKTNSEVRRKVQREKRKQQREREMASMNNNGVGGEKKDERRRRIAERGSDRMALITGRINALPPTPPSTTSSPTHRQHPRHAQSLSVSAFDSNSDNHQIAPRHSRPHSLASSAFASDYHEDYAGGAEDNKHDGSIASARLKHQGGFKNRSFDNFEHKGEVEPLMQDSDTTSEFNNHQVSRTKDAAFDPQQPKKLSWRRHTFFSSRELNFCILASENTRALSSLIIALVVVFCYKISGSVLASRPLYMVLLTDITVVIARIYREKVRVLEETRGEKDEACGDAHSWGDAVKLLERGLVAYQAVRGVFIDCSIYLVVVVCGISLM